MAQPISSAPKYARKLCARLSQPIANIRAPTSSKLPVITSGSRIAATVRQLCLLARAAYGPSSTADSPPARWRDATCRSG